MGGIESRRQRGAAIAREHPHADDRDDESHLADAGIRQHASRVALRDSDHDAVERCEQAGGCDCRAPIGQRGSERQEPDHSKDACLDDCPAEHRGGRCRCRRICQRHPEVKWHEARLHAEAGNQQDEYQIALRRGRYRCGGVPYQEAITRDLRGQQHEGHQQERFGQEGEPDIDRAGSPCLRRFVVYHQTGGAEREHREQKIEADHVGGQEHADAAGQCHQPAHHKSPVVRPALQILRSVSARCDPQQRGNAQQHGAGTVDGERQMEAGGTDCEGGIGSDQ